MSLFEISVLIYPPMEFIISERHQVAAAIISKYPFLKDAIGSGLVSYHSSYNQT